MKRFRATVVLAATVLAGCADGTIEFIGDDDDTPDTVEVEGNIRDLNPQVTGANIVVFVFTGLVDDGTFEHFDKQRSDRVESDADPLEFAVSQVESGDLAIVFLQDDVADPDSHIDPGDPIAELDDPDGILEGVRRGETIEITDVDIDFNQGTAEAESIRSVPDTGTDTE